MHSKKIVVVAASVLVALCIGLGIRGIHNAQQPRKFSGKKMKLAVAFPGTTWFVRPDGGTRYSVNVPTGQCNGKADAPYPGTGVNQNCAFKDVRYLFQDASYNTASSFPAWGWVIAGGDTVIIRGSISENVSYRIGWDGPTYTGFGVAGDAIDSGMPPPPSGTAAQHTKILGENYAACHTAGAKTQLHGGWGAFYVMDLHAVSYVDVACLDLTDFSACGRATQKTACDATQDFSQVGIKFSNATTQTTVTDAHIHGLAGSALFGPTGDGVVLSYVDMIGNASSGWNADAGDGTTGMGNLLVQNFNIIGNGCAEQYPLVWPAANSIGDCTDQGSGGYGDGFGTATVNSPAPGWQVHFDQGTVAYNTQDGLDALHIGGQGSTMTATRVLAYGNEGEQLKVGGATATIQDSIINGNCLAMSPGNVIAGFTATALSVLNTQCRAGNVAVLINVTPSDPATFQNNTIFSQGSIGLEVEYALGATDPANTLLYNNNVFVGFLNIGNGSNPTPIFSSTDLNMLTNKGASWTNNAYFGYRSNWTCPSVGESAAICTDPGLVDETYHPISYGNMVPATKNAVVGAGIAIPSILVDFTGLSYSSSTIGALALGSTLSGFEPPVTGGGGGGGGTPIALMPNAFGICLVSQQCQLLSISDTTVVGQIGTGSTWCQTFIFSALTLPAPVTLTNTQLCPYNPNPSVGDLQFAVQQKNTPYTITYALAGGPPQVRSIAGLVTAVTPTIVWSTPASIMTGTKLSTTQLNATATSSGAAVAGTFVYAPVLGTVPAIGTTTLSVTFTPTNTVNFTTAKATVQLTVSPLSVTCTKPITLTPLSTSPWFAVTGCK